MQKYPITPKNTRNSRIPKQNLEFLANLFKNFALVFHLGFFAYFLLL